MTAEVKDELSRLPVTKSCCRKAEVSSLLRFGGGLHIVAGRIVVEADLDAGATARRLRKDLTDRLAKASARLDEITKRLIVVEMNVSEQQIRFRDLVTQIKMLKPLPPA